MIENEGNRIRNVFDIIKSRGWEPVKQYASKRGSVGGVNVKRSCESWCANELWRLVVQ